MRPDPIDLDSPLGISKREWIKVLGVNLALLLIVYTIALVCTLCGSDLFLLNFHSDDLQRIEETLRNWNIYPFIQMGFATIEESLIVMYVMNKRLKWWMPISFFGYITATNFLMTFLLGACPGWLGITNGVLYAIVYITISCIVFKTKPFKMLARLIIAAVITLILNEGISIFRIKVYELYQLNLNNSTFFALSIEYNLALGLTLGFLTLVIPWNKKGGKLTCPTTQAVGGSSPSMMKCSPKPSKIATSNLPPKYRGVPTSSYNIYDFAYVMNMLYSDYYGSVPDNVDTYFKMAKAFLEDKDAPEGKAFRYYKAMCD